MAAAGGRKCKDTEYTGCTQNGTHGKVCEEEYLEEGEKE